MKKLLLTSKRLNIGFVKKQTMGNIPFYSSFDIRDSNFKVACVDANIFPAGFNNICEEDQKRASSLIEKYLDTFYPSAKNILLLTEEHTKNLYYWDNVFVIKSLIEGGGRSVQVCVPGLGIKKAQKIVTASGRELFVHLLAEVKGDLIISNNDFSVQPSLPLSYPLQSAFGNGLVCEKKTSLF